MAAIQTELLAQAKAESEEEQAESAIQVAVLWKVTEQQFKHPFESLEQAFLQLRGAIEPVGTGENIDELDELQRALLATLERSYNHVVHVLNIQHPGKG